MKNKMSKVEKQEVSDEIKKVVSEYVYTNYKNYKEKPLYITQSDNCYYVTSHKDASPLILGKLIFK